MAQTVERVAVPSGEVAYMTLGAGPALLLPWCNLPWPDLSITRALADRYLVVLASPVGYQASSRLPPDEEYDAPRALADLLAVCDAVEIDRFAVFGYSLSAAMAAWLAGTTSRVTSAVLGGFPLLGSYQRVLDGARSDAHEMEGDPGFEPRAALSFYRDLANRADGSLVDECRCPIHAFWGASDEVLERFNAAPDLVDSLTRRGVTTTVVADTDHITTILATDEVVRAVREAVP
jgi:pimeloyl-ACP methyl ester carboxylesterase